jgi:hypothetical protein
VRVAPWRAWTGAAVNGMVEESAGAAVDRGGGGVGWGADWVAVHRLRPAEGGGQGSRR